MAAASCPDFQITMFGTVYDGRDLGFVLQGYDYLRFGSRVRLESEVLDGKLQDASVRWGSRCVNNTGEGGVILGMLRETFKKIMVAICPWAWEEKRLRLKEFSWFMILRRWWVFVLVRLKLSSRSNYLFQRENHAFRAKLLCNFCRSRSRKMITQII